MRLLLAVLLPLAVVAQQCTIGQGTKISCAKHQLIVVDSTSYMNTSDRTSQLAAYINTYLSQFDFSSQTTKVSMGFYGMSDPSISWSPLVLWFGRTDPTDMCTDFSELVYYQGLDNLGICSISTALAALYNTTKVDDWNFDQIVWFTASNDATDIKLAARRILPDFPGTNFTVISLGGGDFSSWGSTRSLCTSFPFSSGYEATISAQACRTAAGSNTCNGHVTSPAPPSTTPSPSNQCPCTPSEIWTDIIVVYDGSNVLSDDNFRQLTTLIQSMISSLPIGQSLGKFTRVGVITYASNVTLIANLTKYTDVYGAITDNWVRDNVESTNIKGAIDLARDIFEDSTQHRPNVRKVILLGASTYREGFDNPNTTANTFKDNEGVIMVIAFGDLKGEASDVLRQLASPGYFIDATTSQPDFQQVNSLLCKANCFCPKPYAAVSSAATGEPVDGCFYLSDVQGLQILASRFCNSENNGSLAITKDSTQKVYTISKVPPGTKVWVGLIFDKTQNKWVWTDGTAFTDKIESGTGECGAIRSLGSFKTAFSQEECLSPYDYACEVIPCSTKTYCA